MTTSTRFNLQPNSLYRPARLQTANRFFCSVNHLSSVGGVSGNHNATRSPSFALKNKTENDSGLLRNSEGNRDDEWNFCRGQEADIVFFLHKTRVRKIRKILLETGRSKATNRETQKQTKRMKIHQSQKKKNVS